MKESTFSRQVTRFFVERNAFVFNVAGGQFQRPGMPDLCIMHQHLAKGCVWFELKVGGNHLSKIQRQVMKQMNERNVDAYCLKSLDSQVWLIRHDEVLISTFHDLHSMWAYITHKQLLP